jgi:hypothetical protein
MWRPVLLALTLGLSTATYANPIEISGSGMEIPKNGTGTHDNANNDASNFFPLENIINAYTTANPSIQLPTLGVKDLSDPAVGAVGLTGFDFAVVHYRVGAGGTTGGGGLTLCEGATPQITVPDGASTVLLLGVALSALGLVRAKTT